MFERVDWKSEPDMNALVSAHALLLRDAPLAETRLRNLADQGSVAAMIYLADEYAHARSLAQNPAAAETMYKRLVEVGWLPAHHHLACLSFKRGAYQEAFSYLEIPVEAGYPPSMYRLALMREKGWGCPVDIAGASVLLKEASNRGHLFAKRELARFYLLGRFGIRRVPKGVLLLASLPFALVRLALSKQPEEEQNRRLVN